MGDRPKRRTYADLEDAPDNNEEEAALDVEPDSDDSELQINEEEDDGGDNEEDDIPEAPMFEQGEDIDAPEAEEADALEEIMEEAPAVNEEEEDGEELFGDNFEKDYEYKPELDHYDPTMLDDKQYGRIAPDARLSAEIALAKRDKRKREKFLAEKMGTEYARRFPQALFGAEDDDADEGFRERARKRKLRKKKKQQEGETPAGIEGFDPLEDLYGIQDLGEVDEDDDEFDDEFDMSIVRTETLSEWIITDAVRRKVKKLFKQFLTGFTDDKGNLIYVERIRSMCASNRSSLEVSYPHLAQYNKLLAVWLVDAPSEMLDVMDEAALDITLKEFPNYISIASEINIRITELLITETLRKIRQTHLNCLIKVAGVVTRRTAVFPQLKTVRFKCTECQTMFGPFKQGTATEMRMNGPCPAVRQNANPTGAASSNANQNQNNQTCGNRKYEIDDEHSEYRNFQRCTLQESPGSVPPGRIPRSKDVVLIGDLIDSCRPGEEVEVTGIFRHCYDVALNRKQGFPVFATLIEANYINKREDVLAAFHISEADEAEIISLSKDPRIDERIIQSIAPSIYGHDEVKTAIALALFGGITKEIGGERGGVISGNKQVGHHRIRGDLNVLLMGDPGMAKSQFLKYVEKTANRAIYATGQGASAVGLTAAVRKDPVTKEWCLEGGALVLADKGVCLIDEFDKMNDKDRTSIHEAMEQQSISISKAGIVTTLQARCSVIAAANPIRGRYDASLPFESNVDLGETILSRFDIICVIRDVVNPVVDERLASFVVDSHVRSHPNQMMENEQYQDSQLFSSATASPSGILPLPQSILRKYIMYAKQKSIPRLEQINEQKLKEVYKSLRAVSRQRSGMMVGVRHLESMLRISEAHARMHLRSFVRDDDVNMAIKVMLTSFISTQKLSVSRILSKEFYSFLSYKRDDNQLLLYILQRLTAETANFIAKIKGITDPTEIKIDMDDFESKAREVGISTVHPFYNSKLFASNNFSIDKREKAIIRSFKVH